MKFNQVTALAAAAIIIPLTGTVAYLTTPQSALAESGQPTLLAQSATPPTQEKGDKRWGKGKGREQMFEQLNLTDTQKAEIEQIRQAARSSREGKREEMRAARDKMQELYASNASAEDLRAQYQTTQSLREASSAERFETKLKIRDVLTPEQRTQLVELMKQKRGKGGRRGGGGPQSFNF
ncbi:MAG: Spy/CpxP family protein refolding chaperone [Thermosynechococcaceae cyanobacterium]